MGEDLIKLLKINLLLPLGAGISNEDVRKGRRMFGVPSPALSVRPGTS
jgi:hypothetical protein